MIRLKRAGRVAVVAAALPLSGCAALFGGHDLAPNGLPRAEDALRRELAQRPEIAYTSVIEGARELPNDDLLRLLYAGTAGRYSGHAREGAHLLDLASYVAEDRVTTSLSREALSLITSDRSLAYVPGGTERLMIPYLAAATYLEAGDLQGAVVEARRIEALLDRMADAGPAGTPGDDPDRRFLHTLAGTIFDAAGEPSSADVAYRRAGWPERDAEDPLDRELEESGEVVVLVESGYVPHRVEQSVMILLPGWQVGRLSDGSAGDRAAAAAEAAGRVLLAANHQYGDRSGYYHDRGYQRPIRLHPWDGIACDDEHDACDDEDGMPYLLRISWPVLYQAPRGVAPVRVRAGELGVDAVARFDVAGGARRDFEEERATILARTLVRAVSKLALSKAAESAVEKKDEGAAHVVGLLTNLGTLLTERADTRCWHLLPGSVSMVRLRLPPGRHELTLELDRDHDGERTIALGPVDVEPGGTTFLTHRIWR